MVEETPSLQAHFGDDQLLFMNYVETVATTILFRVGDYDECDSVMMMNVIVLL